MCHHLPPVLLFFKLQASSFPLLSLIKNKIIFLQLLPFCVKEFGTSQHHHAAKICNLTLQTKFHLLIFRAVGGTVYKCLALVCKCNAAWVVSFIFHLALVWVRFILFSVVLTHCHLLFILFVISQFDKL